VGARTWPVDLNPPEYLLMLPPTGDAHDVRSSYQLRSMTDGRLLLVSGHRRRPGHLESGLIPLEGEQFVTLTRAADQPPHIVVRAPVWDVHVMGSVTPDMALFVARSLRQVSVTGLQPAAYFSSFGERAVGPAAHQPGGLGHAFLLQETGIRS